MFTDAQPYEIVRLPENPLRHLTHCLSFLCVLTKILCVKYAATPLNGNAVQECSNQISCQYWDLLVVNALTGNSGDEWQYEIRNFMHTAWNIVISTSVCLCVCLPVMISPEPHARSVQNSVAAAFAAKGASLSAWKGVMGVQSAGEVWSTIAFWSQNCKYDIKIWKVFPV